MRPLPRIVSGRPKFPPARRRAMRSRSRSRSRATQATTASPTAFVAT
jgi:hypothetical protein